MVAFESRPIHFHDMTSPLALMVYENLLPGSQLADRMKEQGYRVIVRAGSDGLVEQAVREMPLVVIMDLASKQGDLCPAIRELKSNPATSHIPVLAFSNNQNASLQTAASEAGAAMVASDRAILAQLPALLEQLLRVE